MEEDADLIRTASIRLQNKIREDKKKEAENEFF